MKQLISITCLMLLVGCGSGETAPEAPPVQPVALDVPEGMVYVPGGTTRIGAENGLPNEAPPFEATVAPFFLARSPVTVARFRAFIDSTGYQTEAEHFGDGGLFDLEARGWTLRQGASWRHPLGAGTPMAADDHPVTQVSWNDADAFCAWEGKRLPTEVEWEHAARGATNRRDRYAWGEHLDENGSAKANTWNGTFPVRNTGTDGFIYTSPVGTFGETPLGLTDMGGNVWEWTSDWYRPYRSRNDPYTPTAQSEKVQRGGSFMCHESYCHGYRVSARSHSTPETSLFHVGFRCAQDLDAP